MHPLIQGIVLVLFACVIVLLAGGLYAFRHREVHEGVRSVDMRLEVLWTGVAAALLLGIFVAVR